MKCMHCRKLFGDKKKRNSYSWTCSKNLIGNANRESKNKKRRKDKSGLEGKEGIVV